MTAALRGEGTAVTAALRGEGTLTAGITTAAATLSGEGTLTVGGERSQQEKQGLVIAEPGALDETESSLEPPHTG